MPHTSSKHKINYQFLQKPVYAQKLLLRVKLSVIESNIGDVDVSCTSQLLVLTVNTAMFFSRGPKASIYNWFRVGVHP